MQCSNVVARSSCQSHYQGRETEPLWFIQNNPPAHGMLRLIYVSLFNRNNGFDWLRISGEGGLTGKNPSIHALLWKGIYAPRDHLGEVPHNRHSPRNACFIAAPRQRTGCGQQPDSMAGRQERSAFQWCPSPLRWGQLHCGTKPLQPCLKFTRHFPIVAPRSKPYRHNDVERAAQTERSGCIGATMTASAAKPQKPHGHQLRSFRLRRKILSSTVDHRMLEVWSFVCRREALADAFKPAVVTSSLSRLS